jgi:S1-C subfamily serine protease
MRRWIGPICVFAAVFGSGANAQTASTTFSGATAASQMPSNANARSFSFARLLAKVPPGRPWATIRYGLLCGPLRTVTWTAGQQDIRDADYVDAFRAEMRAAGLKVDGEDNIFEPSRSTSDIEVGGILTDIKLDYCSYNADEPRNRNDPVSGTASMAIEWQVYSTIQKTLLAKIQTNGSVNSKSLPRGGVQGLLIGAFRDDVRRLAADPAFRQALSRAPEPTDGLATPDPQAAIALPGSLAAEARSINDAVASVVSIRAGDGTGSGFLASTDGILITDEHVVGEAKLVIVRWSDGAESVGEVVRTCKARDVAIIRTDPRGHRPLALRLNPPQPGEGVFAIGAPLGQALQNTVTRGVLSAYRTMDRLHYIQSDVAVTHGNSGGPLLDEKGEVIGITDLGIRPDGVPEGLNFFTPIADALDFLKAERR